MKSRDLDALVAVKVMGYQKCGGGWTPKDWEEPAIPMPPNYISRRPYIYTFEPSTKMVDAWRVVEKMRERGFDFTLRNHGGKGGSGAIFDTHKTRPKSAWCRDYREWSEEESAPGAICLAALKTLGIEVPS